MDRAIAESTFRRLFDAHYAAIFRYFVRRLGYDEAPDATDEVFLVAWRRLDRVPGEPDSRLWLYSVARNVLANHDRSARRLLRLRAKLAAGAGTAGPDAAGFALSSIDVEAVRTALSALSQRDQEVLRLRAWDGLSHRQIAAVLGCSENAVAVRIHRARQRLAKSLDATGHRGVNRAAHAAEGDEPW